jgi:hypothetical protein
MLMTSAEVANRDAVQPKPQPGAVCTISLLDYPGRLHNRAAVPGVAPSNIRSASLTSLNASIVVLRCGGGETSYLRARHYAEAVLGIMRI